jgi:hypothetical protein
MRRFLAVMLLAAAVLPPVPGHSAAPGPCPADNGTPDRIVTGVFPKELQGSYVLVPFDVPAGSTRVRVKICFDQPDVAIAVPGVVSVRNTLDLGIYQPLAAGDSLYGEKEFRGWGGSSRPNVLITPETSTTVGFLPGAIPAGVWAAEIGVAAVSGPTEGDLDSSVAWRLEIFTASVASDVDDPWQPTPYDTTPAKATPGWYVGDMHVHAEHSNPADATMQETFDYAFKQAGLDFLTLSDYVTDRHWDEIGAYQAKYPEHLIIRSTEVITYRGHINNHASLRYVDYRTGSIYRLEANGSSPTMSSRRCSTPQSTNALASKRNVRRCGRLTLLRAAQPASRIFSDIHASLDAQGRSRGWTQVNHPTIFPSQVPTFANFCRGCSWAYSDAETDWSKVDAFEVSTGPGGTTDPQGNEIGPNPFTPLAIAWYDHLRRMGFDITAVGSSDSHRAGRVSPISTPAGTIPISLSSPVGEASTAVYATELSESGIRDGILAGHAYVKFFSPTGPDLRFTARAVTGGPTVIMGDALDATRATFSARVFNLEKNKSFQPRILFVYRDGIPILAFPVTKADETFSFPGVLAGDYRLQLMRGSAFEALTNPITLRAP